MELLLQDIPKDQNRAKGNPRPRIDFRFGQQSWRALFSRLQWIIQGMKATQNALRSQNLFAHFARCALQEHTIQVCCDAEDFYCLSLPSERGSSSKFPRYTVQQELIDFVFKSETSQAHVLLMPAGCTDEDWASVHWSRCPQRINSLQSKTRWIRQSQFPNYSR